MEESIASGSGKSTDFVTHRWVYFTERLSIEYQKKPNQSNISRQSEQKEISPGPMKTQTKNMFAV